MVARPNDKYKKKTPDAPLIPRQIENMLIAIIRTESLFKVAKKQLELSYFADVERHYAILWDTAVTLYDSTGGMPSSKALKAEIESRAERDPSLTDQMITKLDLLIEAVFTIPMNDQDIAYARTVLTRFLRQRLVCHISRCLGDGVHHEQASTLLDEAAKKASQIESVHSGAIAEPFSEDWVPAALNAKLTRVSFLDNFLRVGDAPNETYLLMGPFGSCKTTLCVQLSVLRAQQSYEEWLESGKDPAKKGKSYLFFYEGGYSEYRLRALSFAGQIQRSRLEDFGDKKIALSNSNELADYERKLFAKQISHGVNVLGEQERIEVVKRQLNPCWRLIDMTGNSGAPGQGGGLLQEIQSIIAADLETDGGYVAGVYIDYLKAAAERHLTVTGKDHAEFRHLIGTFAMHATNEIAVKFHTPVWLLHQLSGEANSRTAGVRHDHSAASESKSAPENVAFSFQVSRLTNENLGVLSCTKHRRAPPMSDSIIAVDGQLGVVHDVNHKYAFDSISRSIVPKSEQNRVASATTTKPKAPALFNFRDL